MKRMIFPLVLLLMFLAQTVQAGGAPVRVFVAEFAVTGAPNRDELKATLQNMLATRLNSDRVQSVATPAEADVIVSSMYVVFGKVFSLDATAKDLSGKIVTRAFEQGDEAGQLIPALGKLAQSLAIHLEKVQAGASASSAVVVTPQAPVVSSPPPLPTPPAAQTDIIKPAERTKIGGVVQASKRLDGAFVGMAPVRTLNNGERELFIAGSHSLKLYREGTEFRLIAEATLPSGEQVLGIDTADLDGDGNQELYVTVYDGERLLSQVWEEKGGALRKIAGDLPYYFRAISLAGEERKIYVQKMGTDQEFAGDVAELYLEGKEYKTRNPIKLPRFGYLYNFNQIADEKGTKMFLVIHPEGYIIVYSLSGEELWRSSDKYGGSEVYVKRRDLNMVAFTGDQFRTTFLEQRLTVTPKGDVIVPHSSGGWNIGNSRSFKKNSMYCFAWNGSFLDEKWHTRESQNYLADYFFDVPRRELVLLEVVSKEGILAKGASVISVKKVE